MEVKWGSVEMIRWSIGMLGRSMAVIRRFVELIGWSIELINKYDANRMEYGSVDWSMDVIGQDGV